jgi:hypothetical protein
MFKTFNCKILTFGFKSVTGAKRILKLSAIRTASVTSSCFTISELDLDIDLEVLLELILHTQFGFSYRKDKQFLKFTTAVINSVHMWARKNSRNRKKRMRNDAKYCLLQKFVSFAARITQ